MLMLAWGLSGLSVMIGAAGLVLVIKDDIEGTNVRQVTSIICGILVLFGCVAVECLFTHNI